MFLWTREIFLGARPWCRCLILTLPHIVCKGTWNFKSWWWSHYISSRGYKVRLLYDDLWFHGHQQPEQVQIDREEMVNVLGDQGDDVQRALELAFLARDLHIAYLQKGTRLTDGVAARQHQWQASREASIMN